MSVGRGGACKYARVMCTLDPVRTWDVLLLGGASGTGKTRVSYRLACHFDVAITPVDDFHVVLERMTTPEQQPALHFWQAHPDPESLSPEPIYARWLDILGVMLPALDAVVENHLGERAPVVLEGDFIHPALAAQDAFGDEPNGGRVRGIFLTRRARSSCCATSPTASPAGEQIRRAQVSALWARWIRPEMRCPRSVCNPSPTLGRAVARILASLDG